MAGLTNQIAARINLYLIDGVLVKSYRHAAGSQSRHHAALTACVCASVQSGGACLDDNAAAEIVASILESGATNHDLCGADRAIKSRSRALGAVDTVLARPRPIDEADQQILVIRQGSRLTDSDWSSECAFAQLHQAIEDWRKHFAISGS
jgi:hypothetical protein